MMSDLDGYSTNNVIPIEKQLCAVQCLKSIALLAFDRKHLKPINNKVHSFTHKDYQKLSILTIIWKKIMVLFLFFYWLLSSEGERCKLCTFKSNITVNAAFDK